MLNQMILISESHALRPHRSTSRRCAAFPRLRPPPRRCPVWSSLLRPCMSGRRLPIISGTRAWRCRVDSRCVICCIWRPQVTDIFKTDKSMHSSWVVPHSGARRALRIHVLVAAGMPRASDRFAQRQWLFRRLCQAGGTWRQRRFHSRSVRAHAHGRGRTESGVFKWLKGSLLFVCSTNLIFLLSIDQILLRYFFLCARAPASRRGRRHSSAARRFVRMAAVRHCTAVGGRRRQMGGCLDRTRSKGVGAMIPTQCVSS